MGDEARNDQNNGTSSTSGTPPPRQNGNNTAKLIAHLKANKVDAAMWATRILAILFTIGYVIPIFGTQQSAFNRVLLSNAAISALRLHQRLPAFSFCREFLSKLFVEDSCHYLMYSLIFFNVQPTLLILIPIVLFAILHSASYLLKLLDIAGQNTWWLARVLISIVEFQAVNILKGAAFCEIFIMPLGIILAFMGRAGLLTPIIYYNFLVMRYSSRRNPYTRNAFAELRMSTENLAHRSPPFIAKILHSGIAFVKRLAPQPQPVPPSSSSSQ